MNSARNQLAGLQLIHKALLGGQLLFAAVLFFLMYTGKAEPGWRSLDRVLQALAIAVAAIAYLGGSKWYFTKKLQAARNSTSIQQKFDHFKKGSLVQWALLELATLFALISFLLTGNLAFFMMAVMLIFIFALLYPGPTKLAILLRETPEDLKML